MAQLLCIRNRKGDFTKKLFWAIFIATIIDAVSTAAGIQMGFIEEANPIMYKAMAFHPALSALLIIVLVGAVLYGIYKVRSKIRWLPIAMSFVLIVKIFIAGLHVYWISQVI